jgi:hypothetical protein
MKRSDLANIIYNAAHKVCSEAESSGAYTGNAHHLTQRITDSVVTDLMGADEKKELLEKPIIRSFVPTQPTHGVRDLETISGFKEDVWASNLSVPKGAQKS